MTRSEQTANEDVVKTLVRQHWDGRAATFDDASHHGIHTPEQRERWLRTLRKQIGDGNCDEVDRRRVLDVGCGTGVISVLLAELGHDVLGIDFAPEMLDRAREKARRDDLGTDRSVQFCRGDAERLGIADDAVELVTARHLIWTLPNPAAAISEWQRVLEPGGRLLLIEGYWDHDEPWDEYEDVHDESPMYHGRRPEERREFLAAEGLREIEFRSLADPALWGREPRHEYYLVVGSVP